MPDAVDAVVTPTPRRKPKPARREIGGRPLKPATLMMGYGYDPVLSEGSLKAPIFLTSTFAFESAAAGKRHFEGITGLREGGAVSQQDHAMMCAGRIRRWASLLAIRRTSWIDQRIRGGVSASLGFLGASTNLPGDGSRPSWRRPACYHWLPRRNSRQPQKTLGWGQSCAGPRGDSAYS